MTAPLSILLLKGGPSAEREVSLVSGAACTQALREKGHRVDEHDLSRDLAALTRVLAKGYDVVFNALHGHYGEDGCVQGALEVLGQRYTHSGVLASAMAMDKPLAKRLFAAAGITTPSGRVVSKEEVLAGDPLPRPYVIKPPAEGSSVGVRIVRQGDNAAPITAETWKYGDWVLVEPYIAGRELTVGVLGDSQGERALSVTELRPKVGFYDYEAKYTEGRTEHLVPAPVDPAVAEQAMATAVEAHRTLGCRSVTRADFRFDDTKGEPGQLYLLEINTQPGMTPLSLVPEQARHCGMSFPDLCQWIVEEAMSR
jgi:D-alanine-D-alanine ligase